MRCSPTNLDLPFTLPSICAVGTGITFWLVPPPQAGASSGSVLDAGSDSNSGSDQALSVPFPSLVCSHLPLPGNGFGKSGFWQTPGARVGDRDSISHPCPQHSSSQTTPGASLANFLPPIPNPDIPSAHLFRYKVSSQSDPPLYKWLPAGTPRSVLHFHS